MVRDPDLSLTRSYSFFTHIQHEMALKEHAKLDVCVLCLHKLHQIFKTTAVDSVSGYKE